jgi:hypothetical protein
MKSHGQADQLLDVAAPQGGSQIVSHTNLEPKRSISRPGQHDHAAQQPHRQPPRQRFFRERQGGSNGIFDHHRQGEETARGRQRTHYCHRDSPAVGLKQDLESREVLHDNLMLWAVPEVPAPSLAPVQDETKPTCRPRATARRASSRTPVAPTIGR